MIVSDKFITFECENKTNSAMKKILCLAIAFVALSFSTANAQNRGDMYVGGILGVGVSSNIIEGESVTAASFTIAPEFGYFVTNRLKVGAAISYGISDSVHALTIGPNLSYYARLCDNLYYTPGVELCFAYGAYEGLSMPGFALGIHMLSVEFRPTKHLGFTANMMSLNYVLLSKHSVNSNSVNFNLGINPTIGIKYYF